MGLYRYFDIPAVLGLCALLYQFKYASGLNFSSDVFARFTELLASKHSWMSVIIFLFGNPVAISGDLVYVFAHLCVPIYAFGI